MSSKPLTRFGVIKTHSKIISVEVKEMTTDGTEGAKYYRVTYELDDGKGERFHNSFVDYSQAAAEANKLIDWGTMVSEVECPTGKVMVRQPDYSCLER